MLAFLAENISAAVCDGAGRKGAHQIKDTPQRKVRIPDAAPKPSAALPNLLTGSAGPQDGSVKKTVSFMDGITPRKSFKETVADGAEIVKSVAVSFWWEKEDGSAASETKMKEHVVISSALAEFLCGGAAKLTPRRSAVLGKDAKVAQTVMKTVEDACEVQMQMCSPKNSLRVTSTMKDLNIIGTREARQKAKAMIVKLGSCCQDDTLEHMMDMWHDHPWASPCDAERFLYGSTDFEPTSLPPAMPRVPQFSSARSTTDNAMGQSATDNAMGRSSWGPGHESELAHLRRQSMRQVRHEPSTGAPQVERVAEVASEDSHGDNEATASGIVRNLSRYSNQGKFNDKLQLFMQGC